MENNGEPNEKLVAVFDSMQESEAVVVGGLLKSAGIEVDVVSREAQQDVLPGVGGIVVLVREEQADEARQVIADFRAHPAIDADSAQSV
jgi:hypothetical protein